MSKTTSGWVLFIGALSMMSGLMAVDVSNLQSWNLAFSPAFVGSALAHLSVVGMAFIGGKLIPTERDPDLRSRSTDSNSSGNNPPIVVNVVDKKVE